MRAWHATVVATAIVMLGCGSDDARNWNPKGNTATPGNPGGDPIQEKMIANQPKDQKVPKSVPKYDAKGQPINTAKLPGMSSATDGTSSAVIE